MPDYEEEKPGVLVAGLSKGGPADKGGLNVGDLIVSIAGGPISNLNTYMTVMALQIAGKPLEVGVMRARKKVLVQVVPQAIAVPHCDRHRPL
jgi:S1-C subfamily serine protease